MRIMPVMVMCYTRPEGLAYYTTNAVVPQCQDSSSHTSVPRWLLTRPGSGAIMWLVGGCFALHIFMSGVLSAVWQGIFHVSGSWAS